MFKKNSSPRVSVSENELYEICHRIVWGENFVQWRNPHTKEEKVCHLPTEVKRHFNLLLSMEKPKESWFHNWSSEIFLFAGISVVALTAKMAIEQYFGGR